MPDKPRIEQNSRNVITLRFDGISAGWEYWLLLMSDNHHDSTKCRRKLERSHLQMAKDRGAMVAFFGDTFDAMQGKFDPRRSLDNVRDEDKGADYYDRIVKHAAEDYGEFADNIIMFGKGNHETKVLDKTNTDLTSNLVYRLNQEYVSSNHRIYSGYVGGYIRCMFTYNKTKRASFNIKHHHDDGGSAPVTRGTIKTNRQAVFLPDADIVVNGHNHQGYILPIARERLTRNGRVKKDLCWFVRVPGYLDSYNDGAEGYAVEKNTGPTPNGSVWLHFYLEGDRIQMKPIPEFD